MKFDVSIIIIGKICSGKSTLANDLSQWLAVPKCSFGRYLADYASRNSVATDRDALQTLGESMIEKDHAGFLDNVILFGGRSSGRIIFEGVRHRSIFEGIRERSQNSLSIFLDVAEDVRLKRFINREKQIDEGHKSEADFVRYNAHPVENEVDLLKSECDFCISSTKSYKDFLKLLGVSL
jgi:adenylate kinase family enzyme